MNTAQAIILELARHDGHGVGLPTLDRALCTGPSKVSRWLDQLEIDGLVERYRRPVYLSAPDGPQVELYRIAAGFSALHALMMIG